MADIFDQIANKQVQPQAAPVGSQPASKSNDIFDVISANGGKVPTVPTPKESGTITNDVGNTVIVPKAGESFTDTMNRAAAQGKKTTQDQINNELQTAPKKAAEVLATAPVIGAVGAAGLAAPGAAIESAPAAAEFATEFAKDHPIIAKLIVKGAEGAGLVTGGGIGNELLKLLGVKWH